MRTLFLVFFLKLNNLMRRFNMVLKFTFLKKLLLSEMFHDFLYISDWSKVKVFIFIDYLKCRLLISGVFVLKFFLKTFHHNFFLLVSDCYEMFRNKFPRIFYEIYFLQNIILFFHIYFTLIHLPITKNNPIRNVLIIFFRQIEIL